MHVNSSVLAQPLKRFIPWAASALIVAMALLCLVGSFNSSHETRRQRSSQEGNSDPSEQEVRPRALGVLPQEPVVGENTPSELPEDDDCNREQEIVEIIASGFLGSDRWKFGIQTHGSVILFQNSGATCQATTGEPASSLLTIEADDSIPGPVILDECGTLRLTGVGVPLLLSGKQSCETKVGLPGAGTVSWTEPFEPDLHPEHIELRLEIAELRPTPPSSEILDLLEGHAAVVGELARLGYLPDEKAHEEAWEVVDELLSTDNRQE